MITCNRCGTSNPAGTIQCRKCGTLLTSMGERGSGTYAGNGGPGGMGNRGNSSSPDQPALPAWLESLRSGMGNADNTAFTSETQSDSDFGDQSRNRPSTSGQPGKSGSLPNQPEQESAPPIFHAADLIDDNALPSWLRAAGEGKAAPAPLNKGETPNTQNTLRPASYGAPNTDENFFAGKENSNRNIDANSLVDEQSLPPWMRQEQGTALHEQRNISASSLIQPDAMPDWMKNMQAPTAAPSSAFSMYEQAKAPATDPFQSPQTLQSSQPAPTAPTGQSARQNISAHDLIDPQSLPNWMRQQEGQTGQAGQAGQSGPFSAASLIDKNVLPQWMREESQRASSASSPLPPTQMQGQQAAQGAGGPMYTQSANPTWQGQTPTAQGNNVQGSSGSKATIPASSFIDMNALPPWLRQSEGGQPPQQQQQPQYPQYPQQHNPAQNGQAGAPRPSYPVPPRAENMRVPSRPRSEMAPNEGSEVAANVFASMLGVASTTPNFPPAPGYPGTQGQQGPQAPQPNMAPMGNPQQGPQGQGMPPYGNMAGMQPMQQAQGYAANMPQQAASPQQGYYPQGAYQAGYTGSNTAGNQSQGNYPLGNAPAMPPNTGGQQPGMPNYGPNYGQNQYPPNAANMGNPTKPPIGGEQQPDAKPAKRGLFEAIRSWLFRS